MPNGLSSVRAATPGLLMSLVLLGVHALPLHAQAGLAGLRTRAEASDYVETSSYDDVVRFLDVVAGASGRIHLTTMGYTSEGRRIPMAVVGDVPDASAASVHASGKLRVYLQGNIHGGEVPGKEALQMMLRAIAMGEHAGWLDDMVLLVVPIYNADGNERVALTNRPRQHGPIGGMGQRPNAQGYDLNRDHMKLDSPEARSLVGMMSAYDPHVAIDLHTTNGTRHAYHLTYSPPLHPGTDPGIVSFLREAWLPAVTEAVASDPGWAFYYYGNAQRRGGEQGWYTFDHRPRFNNNYVGLRNRFAVLGEAYAYATFEDRVTATLRFVEELLDFAAANGDRIEQITEAAAARSLVGTTLPTRAAVARSDEQVEILMGEVAEERHPYTGRTILRRLDTVTPTPMWEYGTFAATDSEVVPAAYFVPAELSAAVDRLEAHGVRTTPLEQTSTLSVQEFAIDSVSSAAREFQGHVERTLHGSWRAVERALPAGTLRVDMAQPLGRLAFYLLEPRSDDGLAAWGLLDDALGDGYPILRARGR